MSKERELLKKILATGWLNNTISCEVEELLAQAEPTAEPVAWMWDEMFCEDWTTVSSVIKPSKSKYVDNVRPLYLTPPKREPLSSIKILELTSKHEYAINLIRAIEKAHGIGENDE